MYFFPYAFENSSCKNLKCLNDKFDEFKKECSKIKIVAISTDSHYAHFAWIQSFAKDLDFKIEIASDLSTNVSKNFGILNEGHSKNCAFIISPNKSIEYFVEFPSKITGQLICDQLLNTLKSLL